jgi:hypothetical protein
MLSGAILPVLLHQDPRYFYKGTGTVLSRTLSIRLPPPSSARETTGAGSRTTLTCLELWPRAPVSNLYYPAGSRLLRLTINNSLINLAGGAVGDLEQEFFLKKMTSKANKSP